MPKLIAFAIVSVGIVFVSWRHLRKPRSHGFFRFFAFECALVFPVENHLPICPRCGDRNPEILGGDEPPQVTLKLD